MKVEDPTADITKAQLETITSINDISFEGKISNLTGIEYCTNLRSFVLYKKNAIEDFSPLTKLSNLQKIYVQLAEKADPEGIFQCKNLTALSLSFDTSNSGARKTKIDLSGIRNLQKLTNLYLRYIKSDDYSAIKYLVNLKEIEIYASDIKILPDLSKCSKLTVLEADYNYNLTDISGVKGVVSLQKVDLKDAHELADISPLKGLTNLRRLYINEVKITKENETAYMDTISSLINLEELGMKNTRICDWHTSMFDSLTHLRYLELPNNEISNLDFLLKHKDTLIKIDLFDNFISNNDVLEQMTNLTNLSIGDNNITDFSFVSKLPELGGSNWGENLPTTTDSSVELALPAGTKEYTIKNDVKDESGNYVAPVESEYYTYNDKTNIITLDIEKLVSIPEYNRNIKYEFQMATVKGQKLYATHDKTIKFAGILTVSGVSEYMTADIGDTITLTVNRWIGLNENETYRYKFVMYHEDKQGAVAIREYDVSNQCKYTLNTEGIYNFYVVLKDQNNKYIVSNDVTINVHPKLSAQMTVNGSTDAITKVQGNKITLKATGFDGSGDYTYKFAAFDEKSQKWYILRDFSKSDTYTYSLDYTGKKQFAVTVKDSAGNSVAANRIYVTVKDKLSGKLTVGGSTAAITKNVGDSITLKVSAAGGIGDYTYKFAVFNEETGKWTVLQDFSKNSSYTTLLKIAGVKQFAVTIKDSQGNTVATNRITVTAKDMTLKGNLTINGSSNAIVITKGKKVTLNATATGGSGRYTYKFAVLNVDTGSWVVLRDFSEASTYNFTCNYPGKKQFAVTVKDSTGKTVATNRIMVTVKN